MTTETAARASSREHIIRSFDFTECEFRAGSGDTLTFEGVASVVDKPYEVRDQFGTFTETIRAGAFNRTLKNPKADVALYINHDTRALPLATRLSGTLDLSANPDLHVVGTLNPNRPSVQEARFAVQDGQASQMSIGFSVPKDPRKDVWNESYTERTIHELNLGEASIVWRGANPHTSSAVRSLADLLDLFPEGDEYDPNEVRRAIAHLQRLLNEPAEIIPAAGPDDSAERAERLAVALQMWERKLTSR